MTEIELHGKETIISMRMRKELRKDDIMILMKEIIIEEREEEAAMIDTLKETVSQYQYQEMELDQLDDLYHLYLVMMLKTCWSWNKGRDTEKDTLITVNR